MIDLVVEKTDLRVIGERRGRGGRFESLPLTKTNKLATNIGR